MRIRYAAALTLALTLAASPAVASTAGSGTGLPVKVQNDSISAYPIGVEANSAAFRCPIATNYQNFPWDTYSYMCNLLAPSASLYAANMDNGISDFYVGAGASVKEWSWSGSTPTYRGCWNGPGRVYINYAQVTLRSSAFYC